MDVAIDQATDHDLRRRPAKRRGTGHRVSDQWRHLQRHHHDRVRHTPPPSRSGSALRHRLRSRQPDRRRGNIEDTSVSVINAATCNATTTVSCHRAQPKLPVGRAPSASPSTRLPATCTSPTATTPSPSSREPVTHLPDPDRILRPPSDTKGAPEILSAGRCPAPRPSLGDTVGSGPYGIAITPNGPPPTSPTVAATPVTPAPPSPKADQLHLHAYSPPRSMTSKTPRARPPLRVKPEALIPQSAVSGAPDRQRM